jgi:hypothetical protein
MVSNFPVAGQNLYNPSSIAWNTLLQFGVVHAIRRFNFGCLFLSKVPRSLPFSKVLCGLFSSWVSLNRHLTLPAFNVADFDAAFIWGDPSPTIDSTALLPIAAPARNLLSRGITQVKHFWDPQTHTWHLPGALFSSPSPRVLTFYRRLISSLRPHSSLPPFTSPFSCSVSADLTLVTDASDPAHPVFFFC